ncbi:two-component system response regulator [Streptomyces sp. Root431]|uniref:response regulator transcription factor n=1 Tax=unclassified Streptomyces TaxID=2593676 RepID=UPI0006F3914A|nr:response regulator transcription factor [Streptomyces sp. Root431]KQX17046.1 two-component system response regulator [Streptomyces sp. Root431]
MTRLLIVEDDPDLALALRVLLTRHGYEVSVAADGREALRLLFAERPALMVLDLLLPELDGWEVLDRTRDMSDLPVLVLSGLGDVDDRVRGLRSGADDYLVKPFDRTELLARVEALLRRSGPRHWVGAHVEEDLRLVPERRAALWQGGEIRLSDIEYRLLQVLVRNRGRVVTTEQLLDQVWDDALAIGRDRVKFAVLRLRRKLRTAGGPHSRDPLEAVRGLGYRYETADRPTGLDRSAGG